MKLVSRHGWRRQKNNKGQVRALVPVEWVATEWVAAEDTKEPNSTADMSRAIRPFDSAIATLRVQLVRETDRIETAERARTVLTVQLAQAEAGLLAARKRGRAVAIPACAPATRRPFARSWRAVTPPGSIASWDSSADRAADAPGAALGDAVRVLNQRPGIHLDGRAAAPHGVLLQLCPPPDRIQAVR
jgi:hypothetical protein